MVIFVCGESPYVIQGENLIVMVLPDADNYTINDLEDLLRDAPVRSVNKVSYLTYKPPRAHPNQAGRFTVIIQENPHDYIEITSAQWVALQKLQNEGRSTAEIYDDEVTVLKQAHHYLNQLIQEYKTNPIDYNQTAR
jgi:hypothetical protein